MTILEHGWLLVRHAGMCRSSRHNHNVGVASLRSAVPPRASASCPCTLLQRLATRVLTLHVSQHRDIGAEFNIASPPIGRRWVNNGLREHAAGGEAEDRSTQPSKQGRGAQSLSGTTVSRSVSRSRMFMYLSCHLGGPWRSLSPTTPLPLTLSANNLLWELETNISGFLHQCSRKVHVANTRRAKLVHLKWENNCYSEGRKCCENADHLCD